jgi:pilus assembly protein CpaB
MSRRSILFLVALTIAAMGATMVIWYVQGIDARAADTQEQATVVVAKERLEPGESVSDALKAGKLVERRVAKSDVPAEAVTSTAGLDGLVTLGTIYPGQQLVSGQLGAPGSEQVLGIPDGRMAISVELTDPARVAGFVSPGSWVAIFFSTREEDLTWDGDKLAAGGYTQLLLPKVQVLGVGDTSMIARTTKDADGTETTEQVPRTILTLAVSQKEAQKVLYTAHFADLSFALRTDRSKADDLPGTAVQDIYRNGVAG